MTNSCLLTKSWEPLGLAAMLQMGPPKASIEYLMFNACKSYSIISPLSPALKSRCPFAQHRASVARDSWPGKNYRNTITSQPTMGSPAISTEWSGATWWKTKCFPRKSVGFCATRRSFLLTFSFFFQVYIFISTAGFVSFTRTYSGKAFQ